MTDQEVLARLREAGYRLTGPRRVLVETLLNAGGPLTAEAVYRRVRKAGMNLSTVYRNLATFCEMGWLDAMPGMNGERHYQVHRFQEPSFSILCLDCGKLNAMQATPDFDLRHAVRAMGFKADTMRVTMAAHCEQLCRHRENA